jgi:hypothetical protein
MAMIHGRTYRSPTSPAAAAPVTPYTPENTEGNRTETDPGQTSAARRAGLNVGTEREITVAPESPVFILTGSYLVI